MNVVTEVMNIRTLRIRIIPAIMNLVQRYVTNFSEEYTEETTTFSSNQIFGAVCT